MIAPKFLLYSKPLLPHGALKHMNVGKVLQSLKRELLKALRHEIELTAFSQRAKIALAKGMLIKTGSSSLTVIAKHPGFFPLLRGQKRQQMTWLTKAERPIPIITDDGRLIFRWATPKTMADGKWYHPGRQPTTVIERARKVARKIVKERLSKELHRQLRLALRGK